MVTEDYSERKKMKNRIANMVILFLTIHISFGAYSKKKKEKTNMFCSAQSLICVSSVRLTVMPN